ncbi:MAG: hypothetical protein IJW41_00775 [Oscillospiraceae bacterium]|nr:hypothetical protein [Oscillospiraceae bacterium]
MTEKTEVINTRFSEREKQIVEQYAAACSLTRSEYLRKRALGYEPRPALGDSFYKLYSKLCDLCNQSMSVETEAALLELITDIRRELMLPRRQSKKDIKGDPAKPALWGEEDPQSAEHLPLAANGKDGG